MATLPPNPTNPLTYLGRKFGFEVRCPKCFKFLTRPTLLPCNHVFCERCLPICGQNGANCAACHHIFMNNEARRAYHMDNIISIFKDMDATFGSTVGPLIVAGAQIPNPAPVVDQVQEKTGENGHQEKDATNVNMEVTNQHNPVVPWAFNLQKLGLELTCPICFKFLTRPTLLPCNHIFCYGCVPLQGQHGARCAICQHQFMDKEIRRGYHMDNIVSIHRSMSTTFFYNVVVPLTSAGVQVPNQNPVVQVQKKTGGNTPKDKNLRTNDMNSVTRNHGRVDLVVGLNSGAQIRNQNPVAQVQEEIGESTPMEKHTLANGEREAKKQKKLTQGTTAHGAVLKTSN